MSDYICVNRINYPGEVIINPKDFYLQKAFRADREKSNIYLLQPVHCNGSGIEIDSTEYNGLKKLYLNELSQGNNK